MPTALIAEDEPLLAAALRADLAAVWPELEVLAVCGDGESALAQALALRPRVCFFDIRMPGMSGLDAAAALAEDWPDDAGALPLVVFVTAYDQYAIAAFEQQAADYLLKPVPRERLALCVERLRPRLTTAAAASRPDTAALEQLRGLLATLGQVPAAPRLTVIPAQLGSVTQLVPVDEVLYFEAADKYVRVVTATAEHLVRISLRELLPQLDPAQFWQVHRGTVVAVRALAQARREDSGKVTLTLRQRPERLVASRLYAHLFKGW